MRKLSILERRRKDTEEIPRTLEEERKDAEEIRRTNDIAAREWVADGIKKNHHRNDSGSDPGDLQTALLKAFLRLYKRMDEENLDDKADYAISKKALSHLEGLFDALVAGGPQGFKAAYRSFLDQPNEELVQNMVCGSVSSIAKDLEIDMRLRSRQPETSRIKNEHEQVGHHHHRPRR